MEFSTSWLLCAVFITWLLVRYFRRDELRNYPGPSIAASTDLWQLWHTYRTMDEPPMVGLHQRYGNVVRIAPKKLIFSDCAAVKDIFSVTKNLRKVC